MTLWQLDTFPAFFPLSLHVVTCCELVCCIRISELDKQEEGI